MWRPKVRGRSWAGSDDNGHIRATVARERDGPWRAWVDDLREVDGDHPTAQAAMLAVDDHVDGRAPAVPQRHAPELVQVIDRDVLVLRAVNTNHLRYRDVLALKNLGSIDELHDAAHRLRTAGYLAGGDGDRQVTVTNEGRAALRRLKDQTERRRMLLDLFYREHPPA